MSAPTDADWVEMVIDLEVAGLITDAHSLVWLMELTGLDPHEVLALMTAEVKRRIDEPVDDWQPEAEWRKEQGL